jgi:lysophospholipase L1-like esterase
MLERFDADVLSYHPHYVIILGGSNDIGWGIASEQIINNLRLMYNLAENKSIKPIACTIPSILGFDDLIIPRLTLNKLIEREAHERNIGFINLFIETSDPKTNRLLQIYSNDGLHLNTEGYKKISEVIFHNLLKKILIQITK